MKKLISCFVIAALCLCVFAGCGTEPAETTAPTTQPVETTAAPTEDLSAKEDLAAAREYLYTIYKNASELTPADFTVVGNVVIGAETYEVQWTADSDTVKFVRGDDNMVTVDVDEQNPEEVTFQLTATVADAAGNTESVSFTHVVPASGLSYDQIVEMAYTLEDGASLPVAQRLYGVITEINDPFNEKYGNITVTIQIGELADKTIQCFRLEGEGAAELAVGDDITVEGVLKNYKGTIEFDKGCQLLGHGEIADLTPLVETAYQLEDGASLPEAVKLRGVITEINDPFNEKYGNITVTIQVGDLADKPIQCFRLEGEGAAELAVGDDITVEGILKNYKGTIEFDKGCQLLSVN